MNEFQFMHAATPSYPIDYMARLPNWQQQEHHQYQEQQRPYVGERRAMSPASRRGAMDRPKTSSPRRMPHAPTGKQFGVSATRVARRPRLRLTQR
jgi:hypothetical protein